MKFLSFHHPSAASASPVVWGEKPLSIAKTAGMTCVVPGLMFDHEWPAKVLGKESIKASPRIWPKALQTALREAVGVLETQCQRAFDQSIDAKKKHLPLWINVCCAGPQGLEGLPCNVLNLGITPEKATQLAHGYTQDRKKAFFVWDALRRMAESYGKSVLGVDQTALAQAYGGILAAQGVETPTELSLQGAEDLAKELCALCAKSGGEAWCANPWEQLQRAMQALWEAAQAPSVCQMRLKSQEAGQTAPMLSVYLQQSMGERVLNGGCGRMQWRNPHEGKKELCGGFLKAAYVEDLTAGWLIPQKAAMFEKAMPQATKSVCECLALLESLFEDAMQVDFVLETPLNGQPVLQILDLRPARRSDEGGFRIAVDLHVEKVISASRALVLTPSEALIKRMHPALEVNGAQALCSGLGASPGAAVGRLALFAEHAEEMAAKGEPSILVREETTPEDINGFHCSKGVVTVHGGFTSHAAVVARGMGMPCIVGASSLGVNYHINTIQAGGSVLKRGDWVSLDGSTGILYVGKVPMVTPDLGDEMHAMLRVADENRTMNVLANADTPQDARNAIDRGGEGIGLCRTEHMFFELERILAFRKMILASTLAEREDSLAAILPIQKKDFQDIFEVMDGMPVTIRFLDPPLHEFLPEGLRSQHRMASTMNVPLEHVQKRVEELHEQNPMMGRRGCRLAVTNPEICVMQTRAILEAACDVKKQGGTPKPKLMIPLVSAIGELQWLRKKIEAVAEDVFSKEKIRVEYEIGVMIETPRAALCASAFAHLADFFSFGTNDLTQMVYGFSRDDTGGFLPRYIEKGVLEDNPFVHIDEQGVGQLLKMVVQRARSVNPRLEIGICGEHGGDPRSVKFFHSMGFDYVSCSPFRILPARLAAGQAAVESSTSTAL